MELIGRKAAAIVILGLLFSLAGCASSGSDDTASLLWPRSKYPTSTLLDFESASDAVFVDAGAGAIHLDSTQAHNGHSSLAIEPGTRQIVIKLATLMRGRDFPGRWTLLGAHFFSPAPTAITAQLFQGQQVLWRHDIQPAPNHWTEAMVDITNASAANSAESAALVFTFAPQTPTVVYCDDLQLINNSQTIVHDGWTIRQSGLSFIGERPGLFSFRLLTSEASDKGWTIEEANSIRARFSSSHGENKTLTIYRDGRSFWDGQFRSFVGKIVGSADAQQAQHTTPAVVSVPDDQGRVNRTTPGDSNNDGYNETTGDYRIVAEARQVDITLSPRTPTLFDPVVQVSGLPPGKIIATVEGRLIESENIVRLPGGNVLVEMPLQLDRPTTLSLRVR